MVDLMPAKNTITLLPEYLSLSGLAVYASASKNTLKKWLREFNMPHYRIGRCIRVRKSEFDVWVKQFRNGTSNDLDYTDKNPAYGLLKKILPPKTSATSTSRTPSTRKTWAGCLRGRGTSYRNLSRSMRNDGDVRDAPG